MLFFAFILCYLSKEFSCNILYLNNAHSVRYRLSLTSNVPNCKPLRETEITEVDYLGRYLLGSKSKGLEEKAGIYFSRISTFQMNVFRHQCQKKRLKLSRLLTLDSLASCFKTNILAKKHKTVFGFISPRNTPWETPQPMFAIYGYSYYRFVSYLGLEDNWRIYRLRPQCMIFN